MTSLIKNDKSTSLSSGELMANPLVSGEKGNRKAPLPAGMDSPNRQGGFLDQLQNLAAAEKASSQRATPKEPRSTKLNPSKEEKTPAIPARQGPSQREGATLAPRKDQGADRNAAPRQASVAPGNSSPRAERGAPAKTPAAGKLGNSDKSLPQQPVQGREAAIKTAPTGQPTVVSPSPGASVSSPETAALRNPQVQPNRNAGPTSLEPTIPGVPVIGEQLLPTSGPLTPIDLEALASLMLTQPELFKEQLAAMAALQPTPLMGAVPLESTSLLSASGVLPQMSVASLKPELSSLVMVDQETPLLQSLQNLTYMLGGNDAVVANAPVLALLTGQLEQIVPASIPAMVSQNPLLQKILGSGDTASWMQESLPLRDILGELGLKGSALAQLVEQQGLGGITTQLDDVLKALGFDTTRIINEATLLQQTVPVDGLQPYMLRAAKIRAQKPQTEQDLLAGAGAAIPMLVQMRPTTSDLVTVSPESTPRPVDASGLDLKSGPMLASDNFALPNVPNESAAAGMLPLDGRSPEATPRPLERAPDLKLAANDPRLSSWLDPGLSAPAGFQAPLTTDDPFAAMTRLWQAEDITSQRFEPTAPAPAEMLDAALFAPLVPTLDPSLLAEAGPSNSAAGTPRISLTEMMSSLVIQDGGGQREGKGSDSSSDGKGSEGQSFTQGDSSSSALLGAPGAAQKGPQGVFQLQAPPPAAPAASLPREVMQQVFDNASMMLKEGGGSIRVDLGNEGMGSLDLALDIRDNTVELRITASSSQVRELLNSELPKLRDSLMSQNLNLEKVEIGLSGGSGWSQSSGDGRSSRGQNFETIEQGSYRGAGGRTSEVRSYTQISDQRQGQMWHPGSIQVRV